MGCTSIYGEAFQQLIQATWYNNPDTEKNIHPEQAQKSCRKLARFFYDQLVLENKTGKRKEIKKIIKHIGDIPLPDGTRYGRQAEEEKWQRKAEKDLWVYKESKEFEEEKNRYEEQKLPQIRAKIATESGVKEGLLKVQIADALINSKGEWREKTKGLKGRRLVIAYPHINPQYYFKLLPEFPGMEYAIHNLTQRFMGKGSPNITYMTITVRENDEKFHQNHPRPYPLLISEAIAQAPSLKGREFEEALVNNPKEIHEKLNLYNYTLWILLSLLTDPEDGNAHNFVLVPGESGLLDLMGIDNDHCFVQALLTDNWLADSAYKRSLSEINQEIIPNDVHATRYLQIKTILYCLDIMLKPLDLQAVQNFLALDSFSVVEAWLADLKKWDKSHRTLLHENKKDYSDFYLHTREDKLFSFTRPVFKERTIEKLYNTISRLRRILSDQERPVTSHIDLVIRVHPLVGRRYRPLLINKELSAFERFTRLTDQLKEYQKIFDEQKQEQKRKEPPGPTLRINPQPRTGQRNLNLPSIPSFTTGSELFHCSDIEEKSLIIQLKEKKAWYPKKALKKWKIYREEKISLSNFQQKVRAKECKNQDIAEWLKKTGLKLPEHRMELIGNIDFKDMSITEQKEILKFLSEDKESKYETLVFKNVTLFSTTQWKRLILQSNDFLRRLYFDQCGGITEPLIIGLPQSSPALQTLSLINTSLRTFDNGSILGSKNLFLQVLEQVELKRSTRLTNIHLHAPALRKLDASGCSSLSSIEIIADSLERLLLRGCDKLRQVKVVTHEGNWERTWKLPNSIPTNNFQAQYAWVCVQLTALYSFKGYGMQDLEDANYWREQLLGTKPERHLLPLLPFRSRVLFCLACHEGLASPMQSDACKALLIEAKMVPESEDMVNITPKQYRSWIYIKAAKANFGRILDILVDSFPEESLSSEQDEEGNTALLIAARYGYLKLVQWLPMKGASLKHRNKIGLNVLLIAALSGQLKVIEWLLLPAEVAAARLAPLKGRMGKFIDWLESLAEPDGVMHKSFLNSIVILIQRMGMNFNLKEERDYDGHSALWLASVNGTPEVLEYFLLNGLLVNDRDRLGSTPLMVASSFGNSQAVQLLLTARAPINDRDYDARTPLMYAVMGGHFDVMQFLLAQGALLGEKDKRGTTLLLFAAASGKPEIVEWLLLHGAKIQETDKNGKTALLYAAESGKLEMVQWLLSHGAKPQEKDKEGYTALLSATFFGYVDIVRWLLTEKHAPIFECNNDGDTALDLATTPQMYTFLEDWAKTNFVSSEHKRLYHEQTDQDDWNSLSAATGLTRDKLISFALRHREEIAYRRLIAPEIAVAAVMTAVYLDGRQSEPVFRAEHAAELLNLWGIPQPYRTIEYIEKIVVALGCAQDEMKMINPDMRRLRSFSLPVAMHSDEVRQLVIAYYTALMGKDILPTKLDSKTESKSEQLLIRLEKVIRNKEENLIRYCEQNELYYQYIMGNYNTVDKTYFLFLPGYRKTSMLDIAARCQKRPIIIYEQLKGVWVECYQTAEAEGIPLDAKPIYLEYYRQSQKFVALHHVPDNVLQAGHDDLTGAFNKFEHMAKRYWAWLFLIAAQKGNLAILRILNERFPKDLLWSERDDYGNTALLVAAWHHQTHVMDYLLSIGSLLQERNHHGNTALLITAAKGNKAGVKNLLELRASPEECNHYGATALLLAAHNGMLETVKWLLTRGGSSLAEQDKEGSTALLFAASGGKLAIIQYLLFSHGVNLTEKNKQGMTALLWATVNGQLNVVEWLLTKQSVFVIGTKSEIKAALSLASVGSKVHLFLKKQLGQYADLPSTDIKSTYQQGSDVSSSSVILGSSTDSPLFSSGLTLSSYSSVLTFKSKTPVLTDIDLKNSPAFRVISDEKLSLHTIDGSDQNCLFNSFALGLAGLAREDQNLKEKIFQKFTEAKSNITEEQWEKCVARIHEYLSQGNNKASVMIQHTLAPILRKIAVDNLSLKELSIRHAFCDELTDNILNGKNSDLLRDKKSDFVEEFNCFKQGLLASKTKLSEQAFEEKVRLKVDQWFFKNNLGFKLYQDHMRKDRTWGAGPEARALGIFFGIIPVICHNKPINAAIGDEWNFGQTSIKYGQTIDEKSDDHTFTDQEYQDLRSAELIIPEALLNNLTPSIIRFAYVTDQYLNKSLLTKPALREKFLKLRKIYYKPPMHILAIYNPHGNHWSVLARPGGYFNIKQKETDFKNETLITSSVSRESDSPPVGFEGSSSWIVNSCHGHSQFKT